MHAFRCDIEPSVTLSLDRLSAQLLRFYSSKDCQATLPLQTGRRSLCSLARADQVNPPQNISPETDAKQTRNRQVKPFSRKLVMIGLTAGPDINENAIRPTIGPNRAYPA